MKKKIVTFFKQFKRKKKKYCAYGTNGFSRFGVLLEETNDYVTVLDSSGWRVCWYKPYVKIFDEEDDALEEVKKWNMVDNSKINKFKKLKNDTSKKIPNTNNFTL